MTDTLETVTIPALDKQQHKLRNAPGMATRGLHATQTYAQGYTWVTDGYVALGAPSSPHLQLGDASGGMKIFIDDAFNNKESAAKYTFRVAEVLARMKYLIELRNESRRPLAAKERVHSVYLSAGGTVEAFTLEQSENYVTILDPQKIIVALENLIGNTSPGRDCTFYVRKRLDTVLIIAPKRAAVLAAMREPAKKDKKA